MTTTDTTDTADRQSSRAGQVEEQGPPPARPAAAADPIVAEVVRNALGAVSNQMQIAIVRTAFSPVIYDINDCACAVYDTKLRLLAQADEGLPAFAGVLGFAIRSCLDLCGGPEDLREGDVLLTTHPSHHGSHLNDFVVIAPVFVDDSLVGYAAAKAHMIDTGGKDPVASIDSTDLLQEGLVVPGVKLYEAGRRNDGVYRIITANSRLPEAIRGDLGSMVGAVRVGAQGFRDVVARHGVDTFRASIETILDHAEEVMREFVRSIPDGRYAGTGVLDGREDDAATEVEVIVEVTGSEIVVDVTGAPAELDFPDNLPVPNTVAVLRCWLMSFLGATEVVNEGHFRPLEVRTRPGSMFHPRPLAPVSIYVMAVSALEGFLDALSKAIPERVPAPGGGDTETLGLMGVRDDASFWVLFSQRFGGQGGLPDRDGSCPLPFVPWSGMRSNSCELYEARSPIVVDECELVPDSAGIGKHRGYPGHRVRIRPRRPLKLLFLLDRAKEGARGLHGGGVGATNQGRLTRAGEAGRAVHKAWVDAAPGDVIEVFYGGGGGFGDPREREPELVHADVEAGYVSEDAARRHYPHAFAEQRRSESP